MIFAVHFDIANKKGGGYDAKFNAITKELRSKEQAQEWRKVTDTCYLILTDETADQLAERIHENLNKQDSLIVVEVDITNRAGWLAPHVWKWCDEQQSRYPNSCRKLSRLFQVGVLNQ